ncbi:MAG: DUF5808 domain-containing protein [Sporolactobacillus sp.]
MSTQTIAFAVMLLVISALLIGQPWLSRKNVLFGAVFADETIWENDEAKRIVRRFLLRSILVFCCLFLLFVLASMKWDTAQSSIYIMAALFIINSIIFILANRETRRLKQRLADERDFSNGKIIVDTAQTDRLVPLSWIAALLPLPILTVILIVVGYHSMPERLPVHFGFSGADAWATKSVAVVLQPLLVGLILTALIVLIRRAPASVKGNPEAAPGYSSYRRYLNGILIVFALINEALTLLIESSFAYPQLLPINQMARITAPLISVISALLTMAMLVLFIRRVRSRKMAGPILNDDARWIFGLFYFNRSDPSLFIEKRIGIGFTINMARPAAWFILLAIIGLAIFMGIVR